MAQNKKSYTPYYHRLRDAVEKQSSSTVERDPDLFQKWYLFSYIYEEGDAHHECACGKKNIKHLFYMKMRGRDGPEILVGSECVNQFKVPKAVELMNLLERGLSVEFVKRINDKMVYKVCKLGASRKKVLVKMFPGLFHKGFIIVKDSENVVKRDDQVEQLIGQLYLKAIDPNENPVKFFIWRFERKRMKSKNAIIIARLIDGVIYKAVWTMKPLRYPWISNRPNECPVCKQSFQPGVTSIIPAERRGERDIWICAKHRK